MSIQAIKSIDAIRFSVWSPTEIRKYSVAEITAPETYDEDGMPVQGGLMDGRLGTLDNTTLCQDQTQIQQLTILLKEQEAQCLTCRELLTRIMVRNDKGNIGMKNIFIVVLTLLFPLCVVGCNSEIGNGEFLEFKIGMSQDEVLSALKKNKDITHIQPVLEESISVQEGTPSKEKKIERMLDSDGVILENGKSNLIIEIIFYRSSVTNVSSIGLHKENKLGIKVGMSKNEVKNIISESFSDGSINLAYNYLPDGDWRELDKVSTSEFGNYNHWGFHGASKYSYTKFNFVDGVLKTIDNKWSPIELP